jgi:hypothetical protein
MISRGKKLIALLISTAVIASFPSCSSDVEQIKRNTEKHNQTSRNILNTYAFIHTINVDFTLFMQNSITVLCGAVLLFQSSVM